MKILVCLLPDSGHLHPFVPYLQALADAGHEVRIATEASFGASIIHLGFEVSDCGIDVNEGIRRASPDASVRRAPDLPPSFVLQNVFAGSMPRAAVPDLEEIVADWQPGLIFRDQIEHASWIVAERRAIPYVTLTYGKNPLHPAFLQPTGDALVTLRAEFGLVPDPELTFLTRGLVLVPATPEFSGVVETELPTFRHVRYVPFDESGRETVPAWLDQLPPTLPFVYATLGTVFNTFPEVFGTILDALGDVGVAGLVTVGRQNDPASYGSPPAGVRIERYVPASRALTRARVAVVHGGFNTVMTCIAAGVPMVIVPLGADQPVNAAIARAMGVARVIEPAELTPETLAAALRHVLSFGDMHARAAEVSAQLRALPGPSDVVGLIEAVASGAAGLDHPGPERERRDTIDLTQY